MHPSTSTTALRRVGRAALLATLVVALTASAVLAGKPTRGATIRIADGVFGGTTVAVAGPTSATWAHAMCWQNGVMVWESYRQLDANRSATFTLGPTPSWSGGSATCKAEDGYWRRGSTWRVTSTTTFSVAAG